LAGYWISFVVNAESGDRGEPFNMNMSYLASEYLNGFSAKAA
jgi:hypothetical protein